MNVYIQVLLVLILRIKGEKCNTDRILEKVNEELARHCTYEINHLNAEYVVKFEEYHNENIVVASGEMEKIPFFNHLLNLSNKRNEINIEFEFSPSALDLMLSIIRRDKIRAAEILQHCHGEFYQLLYHDLNFLCVHAFSIEKGSTLFISIYTYLNALLFNILATPRHLIAYELPYVPDIHGECCASLVYTSISKHCIDFVFSTHSNLQNVKLFFVRDEWRAYFFGQIVNSVDSADFHFCMRICAVLEVAVLNISQLSIKTVVRREFFSLFSSLTGLRCFSVLRDFISCAHVNLTVVPSPAYILDIIKTRISEQRVLISIQEIMKNHELNVLIFARYNEFVQLDHNHLAENILNESGFLERETRKYFHEDVLPLHGLFPPKLKLHITLPIEDSFFNTSKMPNTVHYIDHDLVVALFLGGDIPEIHGKFYKRALESHNNNVNNKTFMYSGQETNSLEFSNSIARSLNVIHNIKMLPQYRASETAITLNLYSACDYTYSLSLMSIFSQINITELKIVEYFVESSDLDLRKGAEVLLKALDKNKNVQELPSYATNMIHYLEMLESIKKITWSGYGISSDETHLRNNSLLSNIIEYKQYFFKNAEYLLFYEIQLDLKKLFENIKHSTKLRELKIINCIPCDWTAAQPVEYAKYIMEFLNDSPVEYFVITCLEPFDKSILHTLRSLEKKFVFKHTKVEEYSIFKYFYEWRRRN
ncbi:hypothetical protein ENBRE01_2497 [Enteropsectra breve]|nr:hypothetical protein ENBRE01_2497 [Enteropsectra breve]